MTLLLIMMSCILGTARSHEVQISKTVGTSTMLRSGSSRNLVL